MFKNENDTQTDLTLSQQKELTRLQKIWWRGLPKSERTRILDKVAEDIIENYH